MNQNLKQKPEKVEPVNVVVIDRDERVVLEFDKAVSWIGLEPVQALRVAEQIKAAAVGILRSKPAKY